MQHLQMKTCKISSLAECLDPQHDVGPPYPICLDTNEHEDVECSLCINMKTFLGHLFYSNPKLIQAFCIAPLFANIYHLMHDSDLSESLKIRTTQGLISKKTRPVNWKFKNPSLKFF